MWNGEKELFLRFCSLPPQAPQFMNSWEISFSQEKDEFLVHIKVEMTKTDCITQKKRCFLKKGDRAQPLLKHTHAHTHTHTHTHTKSKIHEYSKQKKIFFKR